MNLDSKNGTLVAGGALGGGSIHSIPYVLKHNHFSHRQRWWRSHGEGVEASWSNQSNLVEARAK